MCAKYFDDEQSYKNVDATFKSSDTSSVKNSFDSACFREKSSNLNTSNSGNSRNVVAVVLAAGSGKRLGCDLPKSLVSLTDCNSKSGVADSTILGQALKNICKVDCVRKIVITVPTGFLNVYEKLLRTDTFFASALDEQFFSLVEGGVSRQNSVFKALRYIQNHMNFLNLDSAAVLVHDAARCFMPVKIIEKLVDVYFDLSDCKTSKCSNNSSLCESASDKYIINNNSKDSFSVNNNFCVIPVLPIVDSIKKIINFTELFSQESHFVDRSQFYKILTPQIFSLENLIFLHKKFYDRSLIECSAFCDDSSMVEKAGGKIYHILGDEAGFKITTPLDLIIAKHMYANFNAIE